VLPQGFFEEKGQPSVKHFGKYVPPFNINYSKLHIWLPFFCGGGNEALFEYNMEMV
jgi:hypothetical protein